MRIFNQDDGCQIWKGCEGSSFHTSDFNICVEDSPRAAGKYVITREAKLMIEDGLEDSHKARLTTMLIDQRKIGVEWPEVTTVTIEQAKKKPALSVQERANRLLEFISAISKNVGEKVSIDSRSKEEYGACAWSESTTTEEILYFINYLCGNNWLQNTPYIGMIFRGNLTVDGYKRIEEQIANIDSSQAFVAMWFDDSMNDVFAEGIIPAIKDAGYQSFRIDQKEHNNKIDDEIIAEIRRSRFIVADFTQGTDGARGGVYYEAGFAHGLGLPVIFTCHRDSVESLHFDTNHYNHIVWDEPADLRDKLKNRILAVMGEGPQIHKGA